MRRQHMEVVLFCLLIKENETLNSEKSTLIGVMRRNSLTCGESLNAGQIFFESVGHKNDREETRRICRRYNDR